MKSRARRLGGVGALALSFVLLQAGGPLVVDPGGRVFRWNPAVRVNFTIDQGPLGILSNEAAAQKVRSAFQKWEEVPSAAIRFEDGGFLDQDITDENFETFLGPGQVRPENPIIFDDDGKIIDLILGQDSSDSVVGFAGIRFVNPTSGLFVSGFAVFNGLNAHLAVFDQMMVHEIGHLIGLDHTQANHELASSFLEQHFVPVMYPFLLTGGPRSPIRDDIAWVSWLYPQPDFAAATGTIRGRIMRRSGSPLAGANVVAVQVTEGGEGSLQLSRSEVVSVVSDFLIETNGGYELPGLTPGDYVVFIEPLRSAFTEGSNVGPFDSRPTHFPKDFYNGEGETGDESDDPNEKVIIQVAPGSLVEGIDLVANEPANRLDLLGDDDEMLYQFPDNFRFPFFGIVYREVYVNSDGNLTFEIGDGLVGAARSEERFLSGPPRIAPLFTDLDPAAGGSVETLEEPGKITFRWNGVPEFGGGPAGNRFSVSLFSNGDILFDYEEVHVTPDPSLQFPEDGLQAIVGITPGGGLPGSSRDLSAMDGRFPIENEPIYEVFPGTTFNLTGRQIRFQGERSRLFYPFYRGDAATFTGFAVTNYSDGGAEIEISALGSDGELLPFPRNPHLEEVPTQTQIARVGSEFFNVDSATEQRGWVMMSSDTPELASFFQFGDVVNKLDGSVAFTEQSNVLYFTRLLEGPSAVSTLQGGRGAQTLLSIANPNDEAVSLTLHLHPPGAEESGAGALENPLSAERALPARGLLVESLSSLFNLTGPVDGGFVKVEVGGPGAVGFALIDLDDTVMGLNAAVPSDHATSFSAQLASGDASGLHFFTSVKLVNTAEEPRTVTLTAYREDGSLLGVFEGLALDPNESFQGFVNTIFNLGSVLDPATVGSLKVEADGPGVIGDVWFGDPIRLEFGAALPLQTRLFTRAVFSQVASGAIEQGNPALTFFTGVALYNPNQEEAEVTIRVFDPEGNLVGETLPPITLGPNQRLSDVIGSLVPSVTVRLGGYIAIESTRPLVAQQLFGNLSLSFLSAVPPTVVQ